MSNNASNKIAVSVIIPITTTETYLARCLDSVLAQTLHNIEVILVDISSDIPSSLCAKYAGQDSRIKILSKRGVGYGAAFNAGLAEATGEYIAFVDSCDWLEPEMYKELYKIATDQQIDVVHCLTYNNQKGMDLTVSNPFANANMNYVNVKSEYKFNVPRLLLYSEYLYSTIYKKRFIFNHNIVFSEIPGSNAQNLGFTFLVFCYLGSFYIHEAALYHLNPNRRYFTDKSYKVALDSVDEYLHILDLIDKRDLEDKYIGKRYLHLGMVKIFRHIRHRFDNHCKTVIQKIEFLRRVSIVLKSYHPYVEESQFLGPVGKNLYKRFLFNPVQTALIYRAKHALKIIQTNIDFNMKKKQIRIFGVRLFFYKRNPNYLTFNFLYIPILKIKVIKDELEGISIRTYYFFTLQVLKTINQIDYLNSSWHSKRVARGIHLDLWRNPLGHIKAEHMTIFPVYKDCNRGKCVIIVGSGETLKYSPEIKNNILILCNKNLNLFGKSADYIFGSEYINDKDFAECILKNNSAKIFLDGLNINIKDHLHNHAKMERKDNIVYYFGHWLLNYEPKGNIEETPLAYFGDTVGSALHFALYTKPDTIYLIGVDINDRIGKNSYQKYNASDDEILYGYKKLKHLRDTEFPNTRIVSINPVGLKGIFDEIYTKSYINHKGLVGIEGIDNIEDMKQISSGVDINKKLSLPDAQSHKYDKSSVYIFNMRLAQKKSNATNKKKMVYTSHIDKFLKHLNIDYDDVYIVGGGSGESFMFLATQAENFIKRNNSSKPVFIFASHRQGLISLAELYFPRFAAVAADADIFPTPWSSYRFFDGNPGEFRGHRYFKTPLGRAYYGDNETPAVSTYYNIWYHFKIFHSNSIDSSDYVSYSKPEISKELIDSLEYKIKPIGLNMDKFILIVSGANYYCKIPQGFWQIIADSIKERGFEIFQNFRDETTYIEGCKYTALSFAELFVLSQRAKAIISLRSGLGEILLHTKTPHIVIYSGGANLNYTQLDKQAAFWSFRNDPISQDVPISEINFFDFENNEKAAEKVLLDLYAMIPNV